MGQVSGVRCTSSHEVDDSPIHYYLVDLIVMSHKRREKYVASNASLRFDRTQHCKKTSCIQCDVNMMDLEVVLVSVDFI
jgi:hypothetical protein